MLKKVVTYLDFNGDEQTEELYFNLKEDEIVKLDVQFPGGLEDYISKFDAERRPEDILSLFEHVIKSAYGKKSDDGRHFMKDPIETELFISSAAYSALFMELVQDADQAAAFFVGLISTTTVSPKKK